MAEVSSGARSLLSVPWIYNLWSALVGGRQAGVNLAENYLKVRDGEAILDIGCGTGAFLEVLPESVEYTGFDISADYIAQARARFGNRATFVHAAVGEKPPLEESHFDLAMAVGVLHHLDDGEAGELFELAYQALKPHGRLVTIDPVFADGQPRLARWIISRDRGQNVRTKDGYKALIPGTYGENETLVVNDLIRIPYTHLVMTCRKPGP